MKRPNQGKTEVISFDELIDIITDNQGEEIKKQIRAIELKNTPKNNKIVDKK